MNLAVIWPFLLGVHELTHFYYVRRKTAIIMMKIIRVTMHNLVAMDFCTPVVVYVLLVHDASSLGD